jgi:hypothetical protein
MLSLDECKKYLGNELSDETIVAVRDAIYSLAEDALDKHLFGGSVSVNGHEKEETTKQA